MGAPRTTVCPGCTTLQLCQPASMTRDTAQGALCCSHTHTDLDHPSFDRGRCNCSAHMHVHCGCAGLDHTFALFLPSFIVCKRCTMYLGCA